MTAPWLADDDLYWAVANAEQTLRAVLRELDQARRPTRDLTAEIKAALADRPLTVPELGKAVCARHSDVRETLRAHPDSFECVLGVSGRSPKAKCWRNASVASTARPDTPDESLEALGA